MLCVPSGVTPFWSVFPDGCALITLCLRWDSGSIWRSQYCPGLDLCFPFQIPELSSSEDESPPRMPRRPPWKMPTKHSTPEGQEPALHWSPRPRGQASYLRESPVPAHSTQDLGSHLAGLSPGATFKRRRLSTIYALEERPSMQAGSCSDPSALRDDSPVPASLARSQQKAKNLQAKSWPRSTGLPGIPDTTRRKRRDPKGQAAVVGLTLSLPVPPEGS